MKTHPNFPSSQIVASDPPWPVPLAVLADSLAPEILTVEEVGRDGVPRLDFDCVPSARFSLDECVS